MRVGPLILEGGEDSGQEKHLDEVKGLAKGADLHVSQDGCKYTGQSRDDNSLNDGHSTLHVTAPVNPYRDRA